MRLGKLEYVPDPLTAKLANFISVPKVPTEYDFDHGRAKLPIAMWGNDQWGDCVEVGKYHGFARLERIETRRTLTISAADVVQHYQQESKDAWGLAPQSPGDPYDRGLVVLSALKDWRANGLSVYARPKNKYRIAAYGELNARDRSELRAACYGLRGVYFGLDLPLSAQYQWEAQQPWDFVSDHGNEIGSWGGHLVYAKRYDDGGFYCITWGKEQYMTNAFIEAYADEAWAVVDDFNTAKKSKWLDVDGLVGYLRQIGASNIG